MKSPVYFILYMLVFFVSGTVTQAQVFGPEKLISRPIVTDPRQAIAADFTNDGLIDVAVAGINGDNVCWFENIGEGVFGEKNLLISSLDYAVTASLAAGDIDGDGYNDIVAYDYNSFPSIFGLQYYNKICYWLKNQGDGTFGPRQLIPVDSNTIRYTQELMLVDFDTDGRLDLISGYDAVWNKNLGNGSWAVYDTIIYQSQTFGDYRFADFDLNGTLDIIRVSNSQFFWGVNDGSGNITDMRLVNAEHVTVSDYEVMDFDSDNYPDIIWCSGDTIGWYRNLGDGTFGERIIISELLISNNVTSNYLRELACGDINNDGLVDVVLNAGYHYAFTNLGSGQFTSPFELPFWISSGHGISLADFNNDNSPDLLFVSGGSYHNNRVGWHESLGNGTFGRENYIAQDNCTTLRGLFDVDSDGDPDVVGYWGWYENTDPLTGEFSSFKNIIPLQDVGPNSFSILAALDLNGDGYKDLVMGGPYNDSMLVLQNNGQNEFNSSFRYPIGFNCKIKSCTIFDFDNDGSNDFVLSCNPQVATSDTVQLIYSNNGNGTYSRVSIAHSEQYTIGEPTRTKAIDVNGDGRTDLVSVAYWAANKALIYHENLGNLNFAEARVLFAGNADDFYYADIDNDLIPDFIYAPSQIESSVYYSKGLGNAMFDIPQFLIPENNDLIFNGISLVDFDLDGDPDLVCNRVASSDFPPAAEFYLMYYENVGGQFTTATVLSFRDDFIAFAADIDGDFDYDLITNNSDNTSSLYLNQTNYPTISSHGLSQGLGSILYPNPASSDLTIQFEQIEPVIRIEIINLNGQQVETFHFSNLQNIHFHFNVAAGTYFAKITTEREITVKKFIKIN